MIIRDENALARLSDEQAQENMWAAAARKAEALQDSAKLLDDPDINPTDWERQQGRSMTHEDFEAKLIKLLPQMRFVPHPKNPTKRVYYIVEPTGVLSQFCIAEAGRVPENSIMDRVYEDVLSPETYRPDYVLSRKDLPKSEIVPHKFNPDGTLAELGYVDFGKDTLMPGFERKIVAYSEVVRGWRTVLALLIFAGLLTVSDVEREFGVQDKPSWAGVTGRRSKATPW